MFTMPWNRLIGGTAVQSGDGTYVYVALGRRIVFRHPDASDLEDYFYSADGHDIEDHFCNGITDQYVWGLGGPNELILRDASGFEDNTGYGNNLGKPESGLSQRIFAEQDAQRKYHRAGRLP